MSSRVQVKVNWLDRAIATLAPSWGLSRLRARTHFGALSRNYEAARPGRRTSGWHRSGADANAANGPALSLLRDHARDLVRNNSWATNGKRIIGRHAVGWGLMPKAVDDDAEARKLLGAAWRRWAGTTACDADGLSTFYGIQRQVIHTVAEAGEVLVRRRWRRPEDGLELPFQLQVIEPDYIDTLKDGITGPAGGRIVQGVEFDKIGRRVAYWLFDEHPGSRYVGGLASRRIPASELLHVFDLVRPGQVRGVSWFAPAILNLKDFDEYEDATIMRQKIAALFSAFVTDPNGTGDSLGQPSTSDDRVEEFEPGMIKYLAPGETVEFAQPPHVGNDGFSERTLRRVAAGLGVTYEDLTGDYSQVNFSSARMARLAHWGNVYDWQWNMLVPRLCDPVWAWAMEAAVDAGMVRAAPGAEWTAPPMPMIDPDKEGLAYTRLVRAGAMTVSEMIREQGRDPELHLEEYASDQARLDELGIWLDSDVRRVSAAGLTQARAGAGGTDGSASGDGNSQGEKAKSSRDAQLELMEQGVRELQEVTASIQAGQAAVSAASAAAFKAVSTEIGRMAVSVEALRAREPAPAPVVNVDTAALGRSVAGAITPLGAQLVELAGQVARVAEAVKPAPLPDLVITRDSEGRIASVEPKKIQQEKE